MIRIDDVIQINEKKKRIKKEIYTKIYEQFASKLKQTVEYGNKYLLCTIPSYVIGYPRFDRTAAAKYIARQFELGGFDVNIIGDVDICISWRVDKKGRSRGSSVQEDVDETQFPDLVNLKKIANQYRK